VRRGAPLLLAGSLLLATATLIAQQTGPAQGGLRLRMSDDLLADSPLRATPGGPAVAAGTGVAAKAPDVTAGDVDPAGPGAHLRGITLRLTSGVRMEGNALRSRYDERRDAVFVAEPKVLLDGGLGRHPFSFSYASTLERYLRLGDESGIGHEFLGQWRWNATRRFRMVFDGGLEYGKDERGELESRTVSTRESDSWREHSYGIGALYGRRIAKAELGAFYELSGIRYTNNDQVARDVDTRTLRLTGRYNHSPRLAYLAELSGAWTDYLSPLSTLDNRQYRTLFGIAWQATAKTSGEILVGRNRVFFHDPTVGDGSSFTWRAKVNWAPRTYSKFTAYTSQETTESAITDAGTSATANTDTLGLRWRYGITPRLDFETGFERSRSEFVTGEVVRFFDWDAGVRYDLNRFVDMIARWDFGSRSSGPHTSDFDNHTVFVGFDARLDHRFKR
jgi:hypothetical protein